MPSFARRALLHAMPGAALAAIATMVATSASAQGIVALPEQMSSIRLSNRDVNHVICAGGEIEDVKFSAEKAIAVERAGSDAWIKFLVKEVEDASMPVASRSFVTTPSEFFVLCNGAVYPLYAEPSDIPAQTVTLAPGSPQRARANEELLGPLVEEERAVSITLAMLQDRVPASFAEVAPRVGSLSVAALPSVQLSERRRVEIEGSGLSASEYLVTAPSQASLEERAFLDRSLGANIFAITLDRTALQPGDTARLIVIRRGAVQ